MICIDFILPVHHSVGTKTAARQTGRSGTGIVFCGQKKEIVVCRTKLDRLLLVDFV